MSKGSFIQTSDPRPKPNFEPTTVQLKGDKYGLLNGGRVFENSKTSEIYVEKDRADPSRYILYIIKK